MARFSGVARESMAAAIFVLFALTFWDRTKRNRPTPKRLRRTILSPVARRPKATFARPNATKRGRDDWRARVRESELVTVKKKKIPPGFEITCKRPLRTLNLRAQRKNSAYVSFLPNLFRRLPFREARSGSSRTPPSSKRHFCSAVQSISPLSRLLCRTRGHNRQ